jgi:hypothetical protein
VGVRGEVKMELKSGPALLEVMLKKVHLVIYILANSFRVSELRVYSSMVSVNT